MSNIAVEETKEAAIEKAKQLPIPKGFRLLCMVPQTQDTFDSGLVKADETRRVEELTTVVLFVVCRYGVEQRLHIAWKYAVVARVFDQQCGLVQCAHGLGHGCV